MNNRNEDSAQASPQTQHRHAWPSGARRSRSSALRTSRSSSVFRNSNKCVGLMNRTRFRFVVAGMSCLAALWMLTQPIAHDALGQDALGQNALGQDVVFDPSSDTAEAAVAVDDVRADGLTSDEIEALRRENNEKYSGGAPLRTNPELEELLRRAMMFADESSYRNATLLWQKVLSDSGDSLITRDGETYYSLTTEVEETISRLPSDGLRQYRITADGEARAAIASAATREEGMHIVVRQFFLSSLGDDAAYYLGCLSLDRYDFLNAQRMFRKIIERYPDPTIPMGEVWLRLAVAAAHVGDQQTATDALTQAQELGVSLDASTMQLVIDDVNNAPNQLLVSTGDAAMDWTTRMGNPARKGYMPALSDAVMASDLASVWSYVFPPNTSTAPTSVVHGSSIRGGGDSDGDFQGPSRDQLSVDDSLVDHWRSNNWRPQGRMLVVGDQVIFKTNTDLVSWNINEAPDQPLWRSLWLNSYRQDEASFKMRQMYQAYGMATTDTLPGETNHVMFFGDTIHHSMCVVGDMVISLEGKRFSRYGGNAPPQPNTGGYQWGTMPRRARTNWMTAYDLNSGKLLWHTEAKAVMYQEYIDDVDDTAAIEDGGLGFMAAPVPFGRLLLTPVSDGGAIWIQALDSANNGEVVWASYLCDEPVGGSENWSPIGMAIEGRDLYVVCGTGVVFSLDAASGAVRFAKRYERTGKQNQQMAQFGNQVSAMELTGWNEDMIVPFGNHLVVMASDHDELFAIHRQTGEITWKAPRSPFDRPAEYCMGFYDNKIFCGGLNTVICYDLAGEGLVKWTYQADGVCFGHGMVTGDGVYLPVENSIVKLDLETGKPIRQVGVSLPGSAPVGNLFSDGKRIWTVAANQVYALGNFEQQIEMLSLAVEAGDVDALRERARLYIKSESIDEGIADYDRLYRLMSASTDRATATSQLLDAFESADLFSIAPRQTLEKLVEFGTSETDGSVSLDAPTLSRRAGLLTVAVNQLGTQTTQADVSLLVDLIDRIDVESILPPVSAILESQIDLLPADRLVAIAGRSESLAIFAIPLLSASNDSRVTTIADSLLQSEDPHSRLAAARALLAVGERSGLSPLVELLASSEIEVRAIAGFTLVSITGGVLPYDALASDEERAALVGQWREWVEGEGTTVELTQPLPPSKHYFGRVLIASPSAGRVFEVNDQREEVWFIEYDDVHAAQGLPNGNLMLAIQGEQMIVEVDRDGNEVWRKDALPGVPSSVQRLENGNTLVVCAHRAGIVLEIDPAGDIVWQVEPGHTPISAQRLDNGNTLVALMSENRVVEFDRSGRVIWELAQQDAPYGARRLANGNTLVALSYRGTIVEYNHNKTLVWSKDGLANVHDMDRLPNGNTVVATASGVVEVDAEGNVVWTEPSREMSKTVVVH